MTLTLPLTLTLTLALTLTLPLALTLALTLTWPWHPGLALTLPLTLTWLPGLPDSAAGAGPWAWPWPCPWAVVGLPESASWRRASWSREAAPDRSRLAVTWRSVPVSASPSRSSADLAPSVSPWARL